MYLLIEDLKQCEYESISAWENEQHYTRWIAKYEADQRDLKNIIIKKDDLLSMQDSELMGLTQALQIEKRRHRVTKATAVGVFVAIAVAVFGIK